MKNDGVPVLDSVAAILRQMRPDFPSPVTITFPWHSWSKSTACTKLSLSRPVSETIPAASMFSTSWARCKIAVLFTSELPFYDCVDFFNDPNERFEVSQRQRIGPIAQRAIRVLVNFHKERIDPCRHTGTGQG